MKTIFQSLVLLIAVFSYSGLSAQTVRQETLKVWGNCGMCKKTIEAAALKGGAISANWDKETKMLSVSYNESSSSSLKVQQAVAASGYDTQDLTGDNAAYEKLPGCCQYDRKLSATEAKAVTKHEACGKKDCKMCNHDAAAGCCESGKCKKGKKGCKDSCKEKEHCAEKGCGKS